MLSEVCPTVICENKNKRKMHCLIVFIMLFIYWLTYKFCPNGHVYVKRGIDYIRFS
ncbi:hypothetical protein LCGC14_1993210, partial [marine sediment metagenome]